MAPAWWLISMAPALGRLLQFKARVTFTVRFKSTWKLIVKKENKKMILDIFLHCLLSNIAT